jgi:hypothetical protein
LGAALGIGGAVVGGGGSGTGVGNTVGQPAGVQKLFSHAKMSKSRSVEPTGDEGPLIYPLAL